MKKILSISFFLFISHVAISQHSSLAYVNLADSLYIHHHYPDAINYYERALKNSNEQGRIMVKIAKGYVKINKVNEANQWFEKAKANHAPFSYEDTYEYIQTLKMLQRRKDAEGILQQILKENPNDLYANDALEDLQNFAKYYKDSSDYKVQSLSFNTPSSEFGPAYFKEGIVFSSAQQGQFGKKKYHWDNSFFLNLYFTQKIGGQDFSAPIMFEEELDTRYHDGPAAFYSGFEKMIINRNTSFKTKEKEDTWLWHLALYDGIRSKDKNVWQFTALPFDQPPYSFAHPSISEDGTVLYFISDKPGGYGGTDIYRITNTNGVWGKAFNLGPIINTPENEVFPFFIDNVLYFASNGRGGLGGLDIFMCTQGVNGFTPPVNVGYPLNSSADDFSLIIKPEVGTGFFSSARNGNDDLFSFKKFDMVDMVAHIYDGKTKEPLIGADVTITTASGKDIQLKTDTAGLVHFQLKQETSYVIVANKDDKTGLLSGFVDKEEKNNKSFVHQVPSYADTTRLLCKGIIHDEEGLAQNNSVVNITDETTGEVLGRMEKSSTVNFMGKKGHTYKIEAQNERGDTAVHRLVIGLHDTGSKTWTMTLKKGLMDMAVRVFNEGDNQPVSGATVKIITFAAVDLDFTSGDDGIVNFSLPPGTAYLVVANKDNLVGMHSGVVEKGMDKPTITHPVAMKGDGRPHLPVVAMILNSKGEIVRGASATVVDKSTGEKKLIEIKNGMLGFSGEPGKSYVVTVEHNNYETASEEISIPAKANDIQRTSFVLKEKKVQEFRMAVRVFKEADQQALAGANVRIVTFADSDQNLIANEDGVVDFSLPEKTPYVVIGDKDGYTGMHSGIADKNMSKEFITHPVAARNDPENQIGVVGLITDKQGNMLNDAQVTVIEKSTGKAMFVQVKNGLLSFVGEKGKSYSVTVEHKQFQSLSKEVSIPADATSLEKIKFTLDDKADNSSIYSMAARVFKISDRLPLSKARVKIITFTEPDQELIADQRGIVNFNLPEGTSYVIVGEKDGYSGMYSGVAKNGSDEKFIVHPVATSNENQLPVVARIANKNGKILDNARVVVTENGSTQEIPFQMNNGIASFMGEKGKSYTIRVEHDDYNAASEKVNIPINAVDTKKVTFALEEKNSKPVSRPSSNMIIVMKDNKDSKVYISSNESLEEIIEMDNTLYLKNDQESKLLGKGSLMELEADPNAMILSLGLSADKVVTMENIYFDYNKAFLNELGKQQLDKAREILQSYPLLQLMIGAHADSRGADNYNLVLSKKRAKAIEVYLSQHGIKSKRIIAKAYGETAPAVPCSTPDCSEEVYQKNRRAEFGLQSGNKAVTETEPSDNAVVAEADHVPATELTKNDVKSGVAEFFEKYGDKQIEELTYKLSIGAYRYNHTLTFDELKNLGAVQLSHIDGITYYFLGDYSTLNVAKNIRQQVIKLGVKDAVITFFYKGEKIPYSTFLTLME